MGCLLLWDDRNVLQNVIMQQARIQCIYLHGWISRKADIISKLFSFVQKDLKITT